MTSDDGVSIVDAATTGILVWAFDAVSGPGTVPGPGTASNDQTSISVVAASTIKMPSLVVITLRHEVCVVRVEARRADVVLVLLTRRRADAVAASVGVSGVELLHAAVAILAHDDVWRCCTRRDT